MRRVSGKSAYSVPHQPRPPPLRALPFLAHPRCAQPARSLQLLRQWMAAGQPAPVPAPSRLAG